MLQSIHPHTIEGLFYVYKEGHRAFSFFKTITYALPKAEEMFLGWSTLRETSLSFVDKLFLRKSFNKVLVDKALK